MLEALFPNGMQYYLLGGLLIGVGVSFIFLMTGYVAGVSTFFSSAWSYVSQLKFFQQESFLKTREWRNYYALGLLAGGMVFLFTSAEGMASTEVQWWRLLVGGFVAGLGARMAGGCTSGHGICGLSSFQWQSLVATIVFMTTAIVTANIMLSLGVAP
jgi:uncharacterized membrane protein YedE/YeeE